MTSKNGAQTAPETVVADQATQRGALRLNSVTLIGIVGAPTDMVALFRQPSGEIQRLKIGDPGPGGTVTGIDATAVVIASAGKTKVFQLPKD